MVEPASADLRWDETMPTAPSQKYALAAQEDRSANRARLSIPASLRPSGGKSFQTVVRDLSLSGFSATAISRIAPGMNCWLTLPGLDAMQARVVWWEESLVGCSFDRLLTPADHEAVIGRWNDGPDRRG